MKSLWNLFSLTFVESFQMKIQTFQNSSSGLLTQLRTIRATEIMAN